MVETLFCGSAAEGQDLGLRHCARLLPTSGTHFGGFFIAVFALDTLLPSPDAGVSPRPMEAEVDSAVPPAMPALLPPLQDADPAVHTAVTQFFGLPDVASRGLVLLGGDIIAFVSQDLRALRCPESQLHLQLLNAGTPLLRRMDARGVGLACWQVCPEGVSCLARMATQRRLHLPRDVLLVLLASREVRGIEQWLHANNCGTEGPVLVYGELCNDNGLTEVIWAGGVVSADAAQVTLLAPSEVLERITQVLQEDGCKEDVRELHTTEIASTSTLGGCW